MRDQASVGNESASVKYQRALDLFTESVMKPDHDLRGCTHNQGCYDELMEIREHVLEYLKTLKEVTHHTNPDESDEIETQKLVNVKPYKCKTFVLDYFFTRDTSTFWVIITNYIYQTSSTVLSPPSIDFFFLSINKGGG